MLIEINNAASTMLIDTLKNYFVAISISLLMTIAGTLGAKAHGPQIGSFLSEDGKAAVERYEYECLILSDKCLADVVKDHEFLVKVVRGGRKFACIDEATPPLFLRDAFMMAIHDHGHFGYVMDILEFAYETYVPCEWGNGDEI